MPERESAAAEEVAKEMSQVKPAESDVPSDELSEAPSDEVSDVQSNDSSSTQASDSDDEPTGEGKA